MIGAIWAQSSDGYIGKNGRIPWDSPEDMKHFSKVTRRSTVVMGRKTWESALPLSGRQEIVLSNYMDRHPHFPAVQFVKSVDAALAAAINEDVWFIGGTNVIESAYDLVNKIWVTVINTKVCEGVRAPYVPVLNDFLMIDSRSISEGTIYEFNRSTWNVQLDTERTVI